MHRLYGMAFAANLLQHQRRVIECRPLQADDAWLDRFTALAAMF